MALQRILCIACFAPLLFALRTRTISEHVLPTQRLLKTPAKNYEEVTSARSPVEVYHLFAALSLTFFNRV